MEPMNKTHSTYANEADRLGRPERADAADALLREVRATLFRGEKSEEKE